MTTALVQAAPPAIPDLIRTFLDGRSPHTLIAYGRDLNDFARFLTDSRQEALGRFFSQPAPAANGDVLRSATTSWPGTWHQPPSTADWRPSGP